MTPRFLENVCAPGLCVNAKLHFTLSDSRLHGSATPSIKRPPAFERRSFLSQLVVAMEFSKNAHVNKLSDNAIFVKV